EAVAQAQRSPSSMDEILPRIGSDSGVTGPKTRHDILADEEAPTPEDLAAEHESRIRLKAFADNLTPAEQKILLPEHGRCKGSRRYLSIAQDAAAFVRGDENGEDVSGSGSTGSGTSSK